MRIAVSGTHGSGKTTLVEDFLAAHPDYAHEPEPYEWLDDAAAEPDAESFHRQLEICVERLASHAPGANVIAERGPVDFLAYLLALVDLERAGRDCALIDSATELAAAGMAHIDLLVVLPLNDADGIVIPESEDLELREAMNERLLELVNADPYSLFATTRVVEVHGTPQQRLLRLEQATKTPANGQNVVT